MATLDTTYFSSVTNHFVSWIDPLSFPEDLSKHTDFDTFYTQNKGTDSVEATEMQRDIFWEIQARKFKQIADTCPVIRQQYRDELTGLIDEVERNGLNFPKISQTNPKYVEKMKDLYRSLNQQTIFFDTRWEDEDNEFGFNHFRITIYSIYPSTYRDQIISSLEEICLHITSSIFDLKSLLSQLAGKLIEFFAESTPPATPPPTNQPKPSIVHIIQAAKPALINDLLPYVDSTQHQALKDLINEGTEPEQPIICQCEQVRLGEIFYETVRAKNKKDRKIQTEKTTLCKWICQYLRRVEGGTVKEVTELVLTNYLKGRGFAEYR